MYKFTNGLVVFDEETKDQYLKAGMKLIKEEVKKIDVEKSNTNGIISKEYARYDKKTSKYKKQN